MNTMNKKNVDQAFAAMERALEKIRGDIAAMDIVETFRRLGNAWVKYAPNQPRVPSGSPDGGQWTDAGGGGANGLGGDRSVSHTSRSHSLTVHSMTRITIHHPNGTDETRIDGDKNWRNNNPGNLIYGDFSRRHGAIGNNHGFAVFPDVAKGYAASAALLKGPTYAPLTIDEAIRTRSPEKENDTPRLQREISAQARLSRMRTMESLNNEEFSRLLEAIHWHEGHEVGVVKTNKP